MLLGVCMAVKSLPRCSVMISTKAAWDSFPSLQPLETELSEAAGCPLRGLADKGEFCTEPQSCVQLDSQTSVLQNSRAEPLVLSTSSSPSHPRPKPGHRKSHLVAEDTLGTRRTKPEMAEEDQQT